MITVAKVADIEVPSPDLLNEPLLWLFAEHYRHREICKRLNAAAGSVVLDKEQTQYFIDFIEFDLPLHIQDEEEDFFPLLRKRSEPEDKLDHTFAMLAGDHEMDLEIGRDLVKILKKACQENRGIGTSQKAKEIVEEFCASQLQHIAIENAVILPIAKLRLTKADKRELGRRLAARRGLSDPFKKAS